MATNTNTTSVNGKNSVDTNNTPTPKVKQEVPNLAPDMTKTAEELWLWWKTPEQATMSDWTTPTPDWTTPTQDNTVAWTAQSIVDETKKTWEELDAANIQAQKDAEAQAKAATFEI